MGRASSISCGAEMRRQALEPAVQLAERQLRNADDRLARHRHRAAFGAQARALAIRAGLGGEEFVQLFAVGGVGGVLVVAAQQVGDHALETPLGVGRGRLDLREVPPELRAVRAVQQQVALRRACSPGWLWTGRTRTRNRPPAFRRIWLLCWMRNSIQPCTAFSGMLCVSSISRLTIAWRTTPSRCRSGRRPPVC